MTKHGGNLLLIPVLLVVALPSLCCADWSVLIPRPVRNGADIEVFE